MSQQPTIAYLDPLQGAEVLCQGPEALARQLSDSLTQTAQVRFSNQPFPTDETFLKSLQVHFEREKLPTRLEFSCYIQPDTLTEAHCDILAALNFRELIVDLSLNNPNFSDFKQFFELMRHYTFRVQLRLFYTEQGVTETQIAQLYFFLRRHMGAYLLNYAPGLFPDLRSEHLFRTLADTSRTVHLARLYDAQVDENAYLVLYEYLRRTLPARVKTVLEINPFAKLRHYRDFNRITLPWKVTLSDIPLGRLDLAQLQSLNKTFDAIVLYQALPRLRDPQKEMLLLQNYARSTTEWLCVQFNTCSLPTMAQLMGNQFTNSLHESGSWPLLRLQGRQSVQSLFDFAGIQFDWIPTRVPIEEMRPLKNELDQLFKADYPAEWDRFLDDADVMIWTGHGVMKLDEQDVQSEGFVSGGFL